ncbi:MAG: hypothetical protein GX424_09305 [Clostridiales bacterium]|jgi:stage II sporulation protein M|nr:hypothetical protein [Clostridiales bacterium]
MIRIYHSFKHRPVFQRGVRLLFRALRENNMMVFFSLFLIGGAVLGAVFAKNADMSSLKKLDFLFYSNFQSRVGQSFFSVFSASFASSFLFILFCFLCGLSMWGMVLIPAAVFFRGFGLGLTSGYIYAAYGGRGILFNLIVILPGALFCCLAILLAAREGTRFSKRIAACGSSDSSKAISRYSIKLYLLRFGVILCVASLAALTDVFLSACFAGMFSF